MTATQTQSPRIPEANGCWQGEERTLTTAIRDTKGAGVPIPLASGANLTRLRLSPGPRGRRVNAKETVHASLLLLFVKVNRA